MTTAERLAGLTCGRRSKYLVLLLWLVLVGVAAPLEVRLFGSLDSESLSSLPAGSEARVAAERARAAFPEPDALVAVAVYARETGLTAADRAKVEADRAAFAPLAAGGTSPAATPSTDGKAVILAFPLAGDDDAQAAATGEIRTRLAEGLPPGLRTELTGSAGAEDDTGDAFEGLDVTLLLTTLGVVTLLLLVGYRSPVLWILPVVGAYGAALVSGAVTYLLAEHAGLTVNFQAQSVMTVIVVGVGIDYALLLIARYREELRRHEDRHHAMRIALRRTFPAVAASAATVSLALLCLLAADFPATYTLGPACAVGVVSALLVMTTLLPALLVTGGRWLFWPFVPRYTPATAGHRAAGRGWDRVARFVDRRSGPVWIGAATVLGLLTLGIGQLSLGLPGSEAFITEVGSVRGQHLIERHFPAGTTSPTEVLTSSGTAAPVAAAARAVPGVASVTRPEASRGGQWSRIRVVLTDEPESRAAQDTVRRLRDAVHAVPGPPALVGGDTAEAVDTESVSRRDDRVVAPLILLVVAIGLGVLLRAVVAPLVLMASVVLTYAAAMGGTGLILSAWGHPKIWYGVPLEGFLFLVALGVDYTVFLMARAREEVTRSGHRTGVLRALTVTGGVVTTAGMVLAATFSSLLVMPLVPSVQIGVLVAVGVLLDTFVVRSLLVPALALRLGRRTWWPGRLSHDPAFQTSAGKETETPAEGTPTEAPGHSPHTFAQ